MKIGFFLDWKVGTLDTNEQNNVLGEEILAMGFCNALKEFDDVESAEVYAPNFLPEEQLDYMKIYNEEEYKEAFNARVDYYEKAYPYDTLK